MNVTDAVKDRLGTVVTKVVGAASGYGHPQSVTIARPREDVQRLWRDPHRLSRVFGDVASVSSEDGHRFEWRLGSHGNETDTWTTTLTEGPGTLRFTGTEAAGAALQLNFRDAPRGLGTEVTLSVLAPIADVLTDTAAFAVLYRARALLQTGEIPTLAGNPSARASSEE
ncbi:hypothetical protein ACWDXV_30225 [Nocardia nova]